MSLETLQNRVINNQTDTLTKMDGELSNMTLKFDAMDEGVRSGFSRIDKDLVALDGRVHRRRKDSEVIEEKLKVAEGRITLLEERSRCRVRRCRVCFGKLSLYQWFAWCSHLVYTSRLVGCLVV